MARLTAAQRRALPDSAFAGPGRSYPIPDRGHAIAAKGRASEFASPSEQAKIKAAVGKRFPGLVGGHKKHKHRRHHH